MSDEHVRTVDAGIGQQHVQLTGELLRVAWRRARFAPTEAGAVVGTDARRRAELRLDRSPVKRERAQAGIEYDSRAALPDAVQVQAVATDIHQLTRRWIALRVARPHDRLVGSAAHREQHDQRQQPEQNTTSPQEPAVPAPLRLRRCDCAR